MTSYNWYEEVPNSISLTQGDILLDIPVPIIEPADSYPFLHASAAEYDVIVMTQACDLENGKVDQISLCVVQPIDQVLKILYKTNTDNDLDFVKNKKQWTRILNDLKKGLHINYHLLNHHVSDNISMKHKVVYLKNTYTMPVKSAQNLLTYKDSRNILRLRLLPPLS